MEDKTISVLDLVGCRILARVGEARSFYTPQRLDEYRVLEVSPSGKWVRLMNPHGAKVWHAIGEVVLIEQLVRLTADRPKTETEA